MLFEVVLLRFIRSMNKFEEWLSFLLLAILIILSTAQIGSRYIFNYSLAWSEELSRYIFIFLAYMGASLAFIKDKHVRVEVIDKILPPRIIPYWRTMIDIIVLIFNLIIATAGYNIVQQAFFMGQVSSANKIQMWIVFAIIPASFILMSIRIIQKIILRHLGLRRDKK